VTKFFQRGKKKEIFFWKVLASEMDNIHQKAIVNQNPAPQQPCNNKINFSKKKSAKIHLKHPEMRNFFEVISP